MTDETQALELVPDNRPGALVERDERVQLEAPPEAFWQRDATYTGISNIDLTDEQAAALTAPVTDDEIDVKPDSFGAVYLSHGAYRRRLNTAFRPGGWCLRRMSEYRRDEVAQMLFVEYALYIRGCYAGAAMGEQAYLGGHGNSQMTWGDAVEGAKSNALIRCCKDLGIAVECWDRRWVEQFKQRACVKVFVAKRGGQTSVAWRRLDQLPLEGETGIADDSPNREQYTQPPPPWWLRDRDGGRRQAAPAQAPAREPGSDDGPPQPSQAPASSQAPRSSGGGERTISKAQATRMFAIARDAGWSKDQYQDAIVKAGYERDTDMPRNKYDKAVDYFRAGPNA